jgi:hypothetical protein
LRLFLQKKSLPSGTARAARVTPPASTKSKSLAPHSLRSPSETPRPRLVAPAAPGLAAAVVAGVAAVVAYVLLLLPFLLRHHGDPSLFIVAGDRFVSAAHTVTPIIVGHHSDGYDGQFYYALAAHPLTASGTTAGVTFDHPVWRAQRILFPAIVHLAALGQAALIPAALLAVNVLSLLALGALAASPTMRRHHGLVPFFAIILWPGLLTTLTHDTTELLACALLLAALLAYLNNCLLLFALLGALAALTRETSSLMLLGILAAALAALRRRRTAAPALAAVAAIIPCVLWHLWIAWWWRGVPDAAPSHSNIGLPLAGVTARILRAMGTLFAFHGVSTKTRLLALFALATALLIVWSAVRMASSAIRAARAPAQIAGGAPPGIAAGWFCMLALMALLSAGGPWIEPTAIFRAFSECWVAGWLLIALDRTPAPLRILFATMPLAAGNWVICFMVLR